MRAEMKQKYHNLAKLKEKKGHIWDVVFRGWYSDRDIRAAHLYPWRSDEHTEAIFGAGAKKEIMTALNGIFLMPEIETTLEKGYMAIVPDVRLEPIEELDPTVDRQTRRDIRSSTPDILENAIEETAGGDSEPDASIIAILANSTIEKTSENLKRGRVDTYYDGTGEDDDTAGEDDDTD
ncbi:hypothetical protein GGR52DRAFT_591824 [Hypoxylon sp. FL1284]|nr:hypothetical protein GGR52DRAFT_591824 [Hypoxylon sp. FL1284]